MSTSCLYGVGIPLLYPIQFSFIYKAPNHNCRLKALQSCLDRVHLGSELAHITGSTRMLVLGQGRPYPSEFWLVLVSPYHRQFG